MKETLVLTVDPHQPDMTKIEIAAALIKKGGLVAFPTETVYGLGADALNAEAVLGLFKAKNRPFDNPPIVHICDLDDVHRLAEEISEKAERLMKAFWPGPLTLIFRRSKIVPAVTVAGLDTIAVRMPRHNVALALINQSSCPIAAPSANLAGKPSPTSAEHVLEDLDGRIDAVLDAGRTRIGVESTVLDLTVDPPQVLRPGGTPYEALLDVLGNVELNPVVVADKPLPIEKARSPGIMHKHYAPKADVVLVEGEVEPVLQKIEELIRVYKAEGKKVGALGTDETTSHYKADVVKSMGSRTDLAGVARNLFRLLRELDAERVDIIIAESVPMKGLGLAVTNRLRKAAGYNIIKANGFVTQ
jgi:L-threonylcarbamoyladenylate synthase